jgi:ferric-dicitrate binding protein FerR (iron transport regulator)
MKSRNAEERYQELAKKWLDKTITPDEQLEFAAWYNADQDALLDIPSAFAENEDILRERILNKINQVIKNKNNRFRKIIPIKWASIAASILLLLAASICFHLKTHKPKQLTIAHQKKQLKNDVAPGGNKALLTLSDGSQIALNEAKNGLITKQGRTQLNKAKSNELVYETSPSQTKNSDVVYNTISTPKGGQFQVVLSDGSKVWLNAASSITFPTTFSKSERRVTITGEVYFEVVKDKHHPFRVVAGKQTVEVLGTHFNINAYIDESAIKTTLIEGSVKVSTGSQITILTPEQQSNIANGSDVISVNTVDTENVLAWTNGNFEFEKAEISFIMRQAARWYDVTIKYEGNISPRRFTGTISRNVNLSELLKMLKYTGINFKIEGQTLIVTS